MPSASYAVDQLCGSSAFRDDISPRDKRVPHRFILTLNGNPCNMVGPGILRLSASLGQDGLWMQFNVVPRRDIPLVTPKSSRTQSSSLYNLQVVQLWESSDFGKSSAFAHHSQISLVFSESCRNEKIVTNTIST